MADLERGVNPTDLKWQAPTQNVDGTAVNGPLNYNLYRAADEVSLILDPTNLFFTVVGTLQPDGTYVAPLGSFPEGRHVTALTAVDAGGDESVLSNSMGFEIRVFPNPPVLIG